MDLDSNFQLMVHDFTTIQKAINHMHRNIMHLQELNRDVMVGKRNTNCISCGLGPQTAPESRHQTISPGARAATDPQQTGQYESLQHVQGLDGRLYIADSDGATRNQSNAHEPGSNYGPAQDAEAFRTGSRSPKRRRLRGLKSAQGYKRITYKNNLTAVSKKSIEVGAVDYGSQTFGPSHSLMLKKGLARAGSQLVEGNDDTNATVLQESQLSSKHRESLRSQTALNQHNNRNVVKIFSKRASTNSGLSSIRQAEPASRAGAHFKNKLPLSYKVQDRMKTNYIDPNIAASGQAQLSGNVAVDFRLANQRGMRNKDANRLLMLPGYDDSASEFANSVYKQKQLGQAHGRTFGNYR